MAGTNHKLYRIEDLLSLQDDGRHWLVKNMLPRIGRTIVYGHGGTYKTTILFDLAIGIASGGALLRQFPIEEQGPVLIVSTESSKYANRDRILTHIRARETQSPELLLRGGRPPMPNTEEMPIYFGHKAFEFDDIREQEAFKEQLEMIKKDTGRYPVFILLDPLDSFIDGDENSAKETKPFRRFCDSVVDDYETSLCVIHHSTKNQENPSIRGSGAWRGWTDTALFFKKQRVIYNMMQLQYVDVDSDKQRDGSEGRIFSVIPEFDAVRKMTTFTCMQEGIDPDVLMQNAIQQQVLQLIRNYAPITQKEIISLTQSTHKRIREALDALNADGVVAQDVSVERSTSADGSRARTVPAWRATTKISQVDAAAALLQAKKRNEEADEEGYNVQVIGPVPLERRHAIQEIFN